MSDQRQGTDDRSAAEKRLRVVIVEDEFVVSMTLRVELEALGCEVVGVARDADSGIEMAYDLKPDLVLMDIGLPRKNGVDATREIMEQSPTNIIVVTAYGDERVQQALDAGARIVLTKPIVEEQISHAIEDITGRRISRRSTDLRTEER